MATAQASRPTTPRPVTAVKAKRNWLADITTKPQRRPSALIVGGTFGIGKSSMAGWIPNAVAMPFTIENTWEVLKSVGAVPAELAIMPPIGSWSELLEALAALRDGDHKHSTLIVDTLGCAERFCHDVVCKRDYEDKHSKFMNYQNGLDSAAVEWRLLIAAFDQLREEKNMSLMLLCHTKIANTRNAEGPDYDKTVPSFDKRLWDLTIGWCDAYLFADYEITVVEKDGKKGKARGGERRTIFTQNSAGHMAKNRLNLPKTIDMGDSGAEAWDNLKNAMAEARKVK